MAATRVGKRYTCATCRAQFLVTRPGELPSCCGSPLTAK